MKPSQEELKQLLIYDEETGQFYWRRVGRRSAWWEGHRAGTTNKFGYVLIGVYGVQYFAHHLAWLYVKGEWATGELDHIDTNPSNNRMGNLRPATSSQQKRNKGVQSNNRSGLKGAFWHGCHKGKKWRSQIKVGPRLIFLGYFETAESAHEAYCAAAKEHFGEFARVA